MLQKKRIYCKKMCNEFIKNSKDKNTWMDIHTIAARVNNSKMEDYWQYNKASQNAFCKEVKQNIGNVRTLLRKEGYLLMTDYINLDKMIVYKILKKGENKYIEKYIETKEKRNNNTQFLYDNTLEIIKDKKLLLKEGDTQKKNIKEIDGKRISFQLGFETLIGIAKVDRRGDIYLLPDDDPLNMYQVKLDELTVIK